ncbi:MAG: 50S ribosome-binding GTPase [Anaerolineales bacterium]|nr:50S ribosome-binding GTPase [Anaerolineales bacterium]
MPTNLPPEYFAVEEKYKAAQTPEEQIELLEELISTIPKHKGTDHLRADLRRRLSRMKEKSQAQKKSGKGSVSPYIIDKEGGGQVALIGYANVGKSTLVAELTNADPEVSPHPYTTWQPTPGMMAIGNVQVQVIDTPPVDREFVEPEFFVMLRRADMILLMVDLEADALTQMEETIKLLIENRIVPLHLKDKYELPGNRYIPLLVLGNKYDDESTDENYHIFCELMDDETPCLPISALTKRNIDVMKQRIYDTLGIMRIYSKSPGKEPDLTAPFVIHKGATIEDFALQLHRDFYDNFKSARVWGSSDFDGQMVSREYVLHDEDVVELKI